MKAAAALLLLATLSFAQEAKRPKITAIDHVDFYTTDAAKNDHLYSELLGLAHAKPIEPGQTQRYLVGSSQWVGYSPAPDASVKNRMDHVALTTDDAETMKKYLAGKGNQRPAIADQMARWQQIIFGEGPGELHHRICPAGKIDSRGGGKERSGFAAHDSCGICGPQPGSRKQVLHRHARIPSLLVWRHEGRQGRLGRATGPEGRDWVEYMLNIKPDADLQTVGVMNHISLGVADMKQTQAKIESRGWKSNSREHYQLGRDGKVQLNIYDPDLTRVELMEFKPREKPCCSEFTAPHPDGP